ncbi:MAG TPA: prolyl oligopeptidase family serine peptidase [Pyrinomonadaceae bacterium]|nr:prolyl oligopeptidase family serine peptidase [Pyrinomonadaceae bacterium]
MKKIEFRIARSVYGLFALALLVAAVAALATISLAPLTSAQSQHPSTNPSMTAHDGAAAKTSPTKFSYPEAKKVEQVDNYFGTMVADPYRWLEDENSSETAKWVEDENKVTFSYLETIPYRAQIKARLEKLLNYPRIGAPSRRGEWFFFSKNDGLQNQSVQYMQKGLDGTPEVLLDPNKFSADGTGVLAANSLTNDGKYLAYGISEGGSDWSKVYVMEVATRKMWPDKVEWLKASGVSWRGDDGFFYSRYPQPEKGKEMTTKNEFQAVYFHKIGTSQSDDELIYDDKEHPQRFQNVGVTEDERYAILNVSERGLGKKGNALFYRDLTSSDKSFKPIVAEIGNDSFGVVDSVDGKFIISTDQGAPNKKVVVFDPANGSWTDLIPEQPEPLQIVSTVGGKLFVTYLKDVSTRAYVYSIDGKLENEITFPGVGTASGFGGRQDDEFLFYSFTSLNYPPSIFKYDIATKKSSLFRSVDIPGFKPTKYETSRVFFPSKDGTKIPMFLVHKKGIKLDGNNPTLMYGYGGFNLTTNPSFNALRIALLEQGFIYASVNMRGGGEYGEKWHEAGMKLKKQNVFDDFIAAGEYLIKQKYTSPQRLAIHGVSNGGLLVGAVANQRPELFSAVIQQAGVMDMLRFHKFTIGWNWKADYGSSENADEFKALYAYSPIHNIKTGTKYPATLITTADHDDRVVPAHSFKYAAALQAAQGGDSPILIRIDTKSGHGASSTTKQLEQNADIYSFLMTNLKVTPKY